jgi:FAD/FMN-containing dehydrogenase
VLNHIPDTRDPLPSPAPWRILLELSLPRREGARELIEELLGLALEQDLALDATIAETDAQAALLWKIRESIPLAERTHGKALKHDVSVPVSRIAEFLDRGRMVVGAAAPGAAIVAFGHVGDGNIHYNVLPPEGANAEAFVEDGGLSTTEAVYDLVVSLNGSISAEHGIGRLKVDDLAARKSSVELDLMRTVKQALDPHNRMNPGRVLRLT